MAHSANEPFTQRIVEVFLRGNLSILLIIVSLLVGVVALWVTPREEEPQIVVPLADVFVSVPGLGAEEVERLVSTRLEKLLYQIDGVEYVYSMSRPGAAIVTVRFFVGQNREDSLVKIYNKVQSNVDKVPADVTGWVVKPVEIDDVPILNITLWSQDPRRYDDYALRRIAEELEIQLQAVENTSATYVISGRPRKVVVDLDPQALAARRTAPLDVAWALGVSNVQSLTTGFDQADRHFTVETGIFFRDAQDIRHAVVNVVDGAAVFLQDVAVVRDGPDEASTYSWIGWGPAAATKRPAFGPPADGFYPAVHIAVAKKKGTNAVWVARAVEGRLEDLARDHIPNGVEYSITRNYGESADDKVNELVEGLAIAVIIVIGLIALTLGWREAMVVAVAVPITFSLTLIVNYLLGYTINRVTLFALTLALGLVVDDPVVDVENIYRHFKMRLESPYRAVLSAVREVRPPIILATLAVIVSFVPMFFITGMMGPYMRPMALNVPISMLMSLVVAFTITPWMTYHVLKGEYGKEAEPPWTVETSLSYRMYVAVVSPFLDSRRRSRLLLGLMGVAFLFAVWLAAGRHVPLKMLPFDNKNEFQIVIDMPKGTTLERTDAAARALGDVLRTVPEMTDFEIYSGTASAIDFNGLVRHYYLRRGPDVADIRVNLVHKKHRAQQSHEIVLRLRQSLDETARRWGANIKLVETPPGPPVIATITAEVYGDAEAPYARLQQAALAVAARLRGEPLVVDVDTTVEAERDKWLFALDKEKAALSGIATEDVGRTVSLVLDGLPATRLHVPDEANPLDVLLRVQRAKRSSIEDLNGVYVKGRPGYVQVHEAGGLRAAPIPLVQLGELGAFHKVLEDQTIYHKNLQRVAYVFADTAGRAPAEAIIDVEADQTSQTVPTKPAQVRPLADRSYFSNGGGEPWRPPNGTWAVWNGEGEWKVTLDVFRDLGIAFGAACLGIYVLLVYETSSYVMPLILMISIPLTVIGIMPGFWLLNHLGGGAVGGYPNPVFFTATAMIGMIALSGIAVRNAILLIDFVHESLRAGHSLREALLSSGAVRFRPIFLTAGAAMLAAWPITLDPIFSGLAWALIFGLFVSTAFTLVITPITYDLVYRNRPGHGLPLHAEED
jgi:multidrug efflux pump subunit AcrB